MIVHLKGGVPGKLAGLVLGRFEAKIPIFGADLLVLPELLFFNVFDKNGDAKWVFPLLPGLQLKAQGLAADFANLSSLFATTWRLDFKTVTKSASTAFDQKTADILMELAHEAFEDPKRKGPLYPGMRLAGGFQVLERIESPNPVNEPWFKKVFWPDTQLYVARNPTCDVAVVYRGGATKLRDIVTDLAIGQQGGFHSGILLAYLSIKKRLTDRLTAAASKHARVYLTGHSLGGGLCSITAHDLMSSGYFATLGVPRNNVVLYAFASPRVMNAQRAKELGARVPHHFAVANKDDIITHNPPAQLGYQHVPRMRVLYPRRAMVPQDGATYGVELIPPADPWFKAHFQDEYTARIRQILPAPRVSLTISGGGYMALNWSFPERERWGYGNDFVALFKGNPWVKGTNGYVTGAWKFASKSGTFVTAVRRATTTTSPTSSNTRRSPSAGSSPRRRSDRVRGRS